VKVPGTGNSRLSFGQFEVSLSEEKLFKRSLPVRLENQPFQILVALLERPGDLVSRQELRARLWPSGTYVDFDEGLNTAIKKLRYALGDSADTPVFVETVPRRGYRFLAPVSVVETEPSAPGNGNRSGLLTTPDNPSNRAALSAPDSLASPPSQRSASFAWKRGLGMSLLVLLALVMAAGGVLYRRTLRRLSANHESMEIRKLPDTGDVESVAISPDGRYVAYARRAGEKVSLRMRQVGSGGDVEILPADAVDFVGLTFSPDGNYLYFARSDKDDPGYKYLYVMPALGGPARKLITDIDSPPSFSPDGRQIVFTRGFPTKNQVQVRIANADGTGDHLLATLGESAAGEQPGASWSPDGRTITVPVLHVGKKLSSALYAIAVADGSRRDLYAGDGEVGRSLWFPGGDGMVVTLHEPDSQRGQMWMIPFPSGRRQRITNDLSNYDLSPDMTADGKNLVAVEQTQVSNIWADPSADASRLQQITFGESAMLEAIETEQRGLVVLGQGELWSMGADGKSRALLAKLGADHVSQCGAFLVASVQVGALPGLVRLDSDGTHLLSLASGTLFSPTCATDGKFVFYADLGSPQRIMRVPIEGGTPVEIAQIPGDGIVGALDISSDGKSLAFPWEQYTPAPSVELSVISATSGRLVRSFKAAPGIYGAGCLRWSPGDSALQYIVTRAGVTNLWQQDLAGGPPKQLTKFASGLIFWFNWSKDGKRLLLTRGSLTGGAVLISRLR
jgi:Tol biopolymer transport system component/DNA-binding winged helix-turn-helix (wHTH) protein